MIVSSKADDAIIRTRKLYPPRFESGSGRFGIILHGEGLTVEANHLRIRPLAIVKRRIAYEVTFNGLGARWIGELPEIADPTPVQPQRAIEVKWPAPGGGTFMVRSLLLTKGYDYHYELILMGSSLLDRVMITTRTEFFS